MFFSVSRGGELLHSSLPFAPDALFTDEEPRLFSHAIFTAEGLINKTGGADTLATYRSWNNNEGEGFVGGLMKCLHGGGGGGGGEGGGGVALLQMDGPGGLDSVEMVV